MTDETSRLLKSFRDVRIQMEKASAGGCMTEALCLLPPTHRAFDSTLQTLRQRLACIPELEELKLEIPDAIEFPPLDDARRVPMHVAGWFCGAVALAMIASFALGFVTGIG